MKQNNASQLLATAYLSSARVPRALIMIKRLCYLGVCLGSCALMLALIITHGFERDIGIKMKGISSDALIQAPGSQIDAATLTSYITTKLPGLIKGASASSTRHLIVNHHDTSHVLFLRGINGKDESVVTSLEAKICAPRNGSLATLLTENNAIIVGKQYALTHKVWLGSAITTYVPHAKNNSSLALEKKLMVITGIFSVGLEDYDSHIAYCRHDTMHTLYETCTGADQLAVSFAPPPWQHASSSFKNWLWCLWQQWHVGQAGYEAACLHTLTLALPNLCVRSWRDLYPDLVSSLELEKYAISFILALIALVASMLIVCLLFMFIQYKQVDIAILRTLGMSSKKIAVLFMYIGMRIVAQSALAGIGIASIIGWYIDAYKPISLPDIYYIAYLPAAVEPIHAIIVLLGTLILGFCACHIPLWQLRHFSVVTILRGQ